MNASALAKAAAVAVTAGSVAGCTFTGFGSLPLPFTPGTGAGSYTVTAQLKNVSTLAPNAEVMVHNTTVGTVTAIRWHDWHADLTLSLPDSVRLPANTTATIGQTSLLGAEYVALVPPVNAKPTGTLTAGDVIPLSRTTAYPSMEDVLAALSTVLNGGGLNQLSTITRELNAALGGHTAQVRDLLARLSTLVGTLNSQRGNLISAITDLNDLAARMRSQDTTLASALDTIPSGLAVLDRQEGNLNQALAAVSNLSTVGNQVISSSRADLLANLRGLQPVLARLADSGSNLAGALNVLATVPFPATTVNKGVLGDYGNLYLTLNLTLPALEKAWITGGSSKSTSVSNPLTAPLTPSAGSGSGSVGGPVGGVLGGLTGGKG